MTLKTINQAYYHSAEEGLSSTPTTNIPSPSPIRNRPLGISVALNGAVTKRFQNPFLPILPAEAVHDAVASWKEGAVLVHAHQREPYSGEQFGDLKWCREFHAGLKAAVPEMVESQATSRRGLVAKQIDSANAALRMMKQWVGIDDLLQSEMIRGLAIDAEPDLGTLFTALETKLGGNAQDSDIAAASYAGDTHTSFSDPVLIERYYDALLSKMIEKGIVPEYEITTSAAMPTIEKLIRNGKCAERIHLIFLFGFSAKLEISADEFASSMDWAQRIRSIHNGPVIVSVGAVIPPHVSAGSERAISDAITAGTHDYLELFDWAFHSNVPDLVRVGLEDCPLHWGKHVTNSELVRLARMECENARVPVMDSREAQALFAPREKGEGGPMV